MNEFGRSQACLLKPSLTVITKLKNKFTNVLPLWFPLLWPPDRTRFLQSSSLEWWTPTHSRKSRPERSSELSASSFSVSVLLQYKQETIQNYFFVYAKENLSLRERTSTQVVCVVAIGGNKQSTWKLRERERKRKKKEKERRERKRTNSQLGNFEREKT